MMIMVAVVTQRDDIVRMLEPEALVGPVMDLQGAGGRAELALESGAFQGQCAHALPMRRAQVLDIRKPTKGGNRLFERLVDFVEAHVHRSYPFTSRAPGGEGVAPLRVAATISASVRWTATRSCSSR